MTCSTSSTTFCDLRSISGARSRREICSTSGLCSKSVASAMWGVEATVVNRIRSQALTRCATSGTTVTVRCRLERHRTVTVVPDVAHLVRACDLILFTTVASTPHIADATLFEHNPLVLHISLRDLAPEILLRSQNVVDDVEHVMKANTSTHLAEQQKGDRSFVTGTLADIMIGRRSVNRSRPIIFSPFGMGILNQIGRAHV